jgi:hypothetical protein
MKRYWLIAALVMLTGMAVSCGDDSGASPEEDEGATRRRVAEALSAGIDFEGGIPVLEPMPETTDEDLVVEQDDAPIELDPGVASLLPFTIENDDEDDPVVATLLQFEDGDEDEHVEVDLELEDGETMAEVMLTVDDSVCDTLCADNFAVKLIQALKTRGGRIGARITRTLLLACPEDGEEAMCESADPGDGDGDGDTGGDGDGDGDGVIDLIDDLARASIAVRGALCECNGNINCSSLQWLTTAERDCVRAAVEEDSANADANFRALVASVQSPATINAITAGPTCEVAGVLGIALPMAEQQTLPDAILACDEDMNTFYPPAASSGDEEPAP